MDNARSRVNIFDENFNLSSFKTIQNPAFMINIGNTFYITGNTKIYKTDSKFNILNQYNLTLNPSYRGIYYNSTNSLLYIVALNLNLIQLFNFALTLNDSISTGLFLPYAIASYNNYLYIGTANGSILIIENKIIINSFNGCAGNIVGLNSIIFDLYGQRYVVQIKFIFTIQIEAIRTTAFQLLYIQDL